MLSKRSPSPTSFYFSVRRRGAALAVICALGLGCSAEQIKEKPIHEVVVAQVEKRDVPRHSDWIGTVDGFNNATIRPQVSGYLLKISYDQGTLVQVGAPLFEIDPREFQAELDSAKGQLGEAEAKLKKTKTYVSRYRPLAKQGAISQQELDDAIQNMLASEASVVSARAQVEQALLNLEWTKIESPIQGVAGISKAQVGDLVGPSSDLATVSQLDPIKVIFPIGENAYMDVVRNQGGQSGRGRLAEIGPILQLFLSDGSAWPERGTPFVVGRNVNASTGTILIEGHFPNPKNVLRPGQFARIRVNTGTIKGALLVPQKAIDDVQGKFLVSLVSKDNVIEVRPVEVGDTFGEDWVVKKGLQEGDTVVVQGIQKAKNGMKVKPTPQTKSPKKPSKSAQRRPASGTSPSASRAPAPPLATDPLLS
ncbi:MAG: efflux RND transporter periplasmic adaptor subunit [Myxococcota bacterium]|nr:efflux RND transporter periplasmic adaptor subunit [Myxococcota bacterium]